MTLLLEHLADLRKSGLADETIALMNISSVDPDEWLTSNGVGSAYRIPYIELQDCGPFYRDRLFPPLTDKDGRQRKYHQPRGGGCRLFVLEPVVDLLQDFTKPIFFVEGEKKAAAGYQAGLGCVCGVGGLWNFLDKSTGELIPEFDRIAWRNRDIFYIPDSDVWARQDLQQAVFEFGSKIRERGGLRFYFIQLTPGPNGRRGLDDFLLTENADALMKLPKVTLGGPGWALAKKAHKARQAKREKKAEEETSQEEIIPPELIAKAKLTRDLMAQVRDTIKRFVFLKDDRYYSLLALWILATYVYQHFDYFPILWITAPTKRSGKTRLLEVLRELASNSTAIWINPSEAVLFRAAHRGKTLFLDEVEKLRNKDADLYGHMMAVLNSGFQRGGSVPRMIKNKDGTQAEGEWNTYGPKAIAGISTVSDTIRDRSLVVEMVRRVRAVEPVERFRRRKLSREFGDIVFQLKIWAAAKGQSLQTIYDGIGGEPDDLKSCDDRFLDIVEPLLTIAAQGDAEHANGSASAFGDLVLLLKDIADDRDDTQGDAAIVIAIDIIGGILGDDDEVFIPSADMLAAVQERPGTNWITSARALATFLSKLGLRPKPEGGGKRRGYTVTRAWLDDVFSRYSSIAAVEVSQVSQSLLDQGVTDENNVSQSTACDTLKW